MSHYSGEYGFEQDDDSDDIEYSEGEVESFHRYNSGSKSLNRFQSEEEEVILRNVERGKNHT